MTSTLARLGWFAALLCLGFISARATVLEGPITNPGNGHHYYLLSPTNWMASQQEAIAMGGNLATIRSGAEQEWIWRTFGTQGGIKRNLWMGLADADRDGVFAWASGESVSHLNWYPGEPNRLGAIEHFGIIMWWSPHWNDFPNLPGPGYGANALPFGVVEVIPLAPLPFRGDELQITRLDSAGVLRWTNRYRAEGAYFVERAGSIEGPWEIVPSVAPFRTNTSSVSVQVALAGATNDFFRVQWLDAPPIEPPHPLRFVDDAVWISPNQSARLTVVDALGRKVPGSNLVFGVTGYRNLKPDSRVFVNSEGEVRLTGSLENSAFYGFRVLASYRGVATTNQAIVVAYPRDSTMTVFKSEEWRLFLPKEWIDHASNRFPDLGRVLDIGRRAQKDLMGWTFGEVWNESNEDLPAVSWESIAEDPNACAYSGNPIGFSRNCFLVGPEGDPWWAAIFHELGHNSASVPGRIMYSDLFYGAGLYVEADANLLSRWSGQAILADPTVGAAAKASVRKQFADNASKGEARLKEWEQLSSPFNDRVGDWLLEGIHLRIADQFGLEFVRRYVRSWRRDDSVQAMLAGPDSPGDWVTRVSVQQRATYMVAAASAAVQEDLRPQFKAWRFPIDDQLFVLLFEHLTASMDRPL